MRQNGYLCARRNRRPGDRHDIPLSFWLEVCGTGELVHERIRNLIVNMRTAGLNSCEFSYGENMGNGVERRLANIVLDLGKVGAYICINTQIRKCR